jgi:hypothetical protein
MNIADYQIAAWTKFEERYKEALTAKSINDFKHHPEEGLFWFYHDLNVLKGNIMNSARLCVKKQSCEWTDLEDPYRLPENYECGNGI